MLTVGVSRKGERISAAEARTRGVCDADAAKALEPPRATG
jgi:hypothetical protein